MTGYSADDSPGMLVRVDLRPSTYAIFERHARETRTPMGVLLSRLADRAVANSPRQGTGAAVATQRASAPPAAPPAPRQAPSVRRPRPPLPPPPTHPNQLDDTIRSLAALGHPDPVIGTQVGWHPQKVFRRRKELGIPSGRSARQAQILAAAQTVAP